MNNFINTQSIEVKFDSPFNDHDIYGKVVSIDGTESMAALYSYRLVFTTRNMQIYNEVFCGKTIGFTIIHSLYNNQFKRQYHGIIDKVTFKHKQIATHSATSEVDYTLEVVPSLAKLQMLKNNRVFYGPDQTVTQIIEKILKAHKIEYELNIKNANIQKLEISIQYNETDYDFLYRLLSTAGLSFFFKYTEKNHILIITNQVNVYYDLENKYLKHFVDVNKSPGLDNVQIQKNFVTIKHQIEVFSFSDPLHIQQSEAQLKQQNQQPVPANLINQQQIYTYKIDDNKQLEQLAVTIANQDKLIELFKADSNYVTLMIGSKFILSGNHFKDIEKIEYVINKLSFSIELNSQAVAQYSNHFSAVSAERLIVPRDVNTKPIIQGIHFAIVVGQNGETTSQEPYSDKQGQVFIRILWQNNTAICKANVLSNNNSYAIPRIGSIVYVTFPNSNFYNDLPIIVGLSNKGLIDFNIENDLFDSIFMTYPATSDVELYNFVAFKDKKEEQTITMQARKDLIVNVANNDTTTINNNRAVKIVEGNDTLDINQGDIKITVSKGTYNIICKGDVAINSDNNINLEAKADINIKSAGQLTIDAKKGINIQTNGAMHTNSQSDTTIKSTGNLTMNSAQNINKKATLAINQNAGTSNNITANVKNTLDATINEIKGKANTKITAPLVNISM